MQVRGLRRFSRREQNPYFLLSRLPEHDIAAHIRIANQRCPPFVEIDNATFRDGDRAVRFGSGISGLNVADLKAGKVGVDVLEFDWGSRFALINEKIAQLDAQIVIGGRLWEPAVLHDLVCASIHERRIVAAQNLAIKIPSFLGIDDIHGVVVEAGLFAQTLDILGLWRKNWKPQAQEVDRQASEWVC